MQTNFIVDKKQLEISLENVDAISLNGKKLSNPMTKAEYEAIAVKDPNTIYLIEETETITAVIPDYSTSDANKILAVNASGTALAWINAPTGEGGSGLTVEQLNQLQAAYQHSQSTHVQASDISNLQPKTDNTLATTNKTIIGAINEIKNLQENSGTGMTPEQTSQLQTAYEHSQSQHASVADLNTIKENLNGKKIIGPITKTEYENITVKDPNALYLIEETKTIADIPDYSTSDANKILAVNASGTALAWINAPTGEGGSGLTVEQINQLQAAYQHSQSSHVQASDIPNISNLQPKTDNTLATTNKTIVGAINEIKNSIISEIPVYSSGDVGKILAVDSSGSSLTWVEASNTGSLSLRDLVAGEIFIKETTSTPTVTYGNIVASTTNLTVNENDSNTFTVKLDKAPTSNQVVNIAVNNSYCTVNPFSLTFTPSSYSITQTVTVNGVHDSSNYTNKTSVITLSSTSVTNKTVNVTINNIDEQPSETIPVQSITLNKTESTLNVGDTEQLTVSINPTNATNQNISWSSSDDGKATVVNGLVTAVASGNATITATSEDGNKTASCNYTVQEVQSGGDFDPSLKMFLNGEGGSERYDSTNCLLWLDQSGNGNNYTFRKNNNSHDNDKIIQYLWQSDRYINLTANVTTINDSDNNNTNFTSLNFTWDIKLNYTVTGQTLILGNGTQSPNASNAFAITTNNGNIIVRGNYDKIAIVNPLTTLMTQNNSYRITVTNDGTTCKLYLDGELISSCDSTRFTSIASESLHISRVNYCYIKYYDRALTDLEIQGGLI